MHIVVSGTIGAGKTTTARALGRALELPVHEEEPERNPFIRRYYSDAQRWALRSQLWFVLDAIERHRRGGVQDHSFLEAAYVFTDVQRSRGEMTPEDVDLIRSTAEIAGRSLPEPDTVVLLLAPVATLVERIAARERQYERGIGVDLLTALDAQRREFFTTWDCSPVIEVDTTTWDPRREHDIRVLADRLRETSRAGS